MPVLPSSRRLPGDSAPATNRASAKVGAYYAGPGNRFWPILHESGLTPRQLLPSEFRNAVQFGIGLTDLSKFQSGADSVLDSGGDDTGRLAEKIAAYAPRVLTFNGKRAGSVFLHEIFAYNIKDYGLRIHCLKANQTTKQRCTYVGSYPCVFLVLLSTRSPDSELPPMTGS